MRLLGFCRYLVKDHNLKNTVIKFFSKSILYLWYITDLKMCTSSTNKRMLELVMETTPTLIS